MHALCITQWHVLGIDLLLLIRSTYYTCAFFSDFTLLRSTLVFAHFTIILIYEAKKKGGGAQTKFLILNHSCCKLKYNMLKKGDKYYWKCHFNQVLWKRKIKKRKKKSKKWLLCISKLQTNFIFPNASRRKWDKGKIFRQMQY